MDIPPQGMEDDMGGIQQPDNMMPPMPNDEMDNQFDSNFDPGVEANEEEDPKKFIQQLTGKLSQSLRKYNENNGQPDIDLNKYVVGMIAKQGMEGLSADDADEIIDKIKADEDFSMEDEQNNLPQNQEEPMTDDANNMPPQGQDFNMQQPNENKKRNFKNKLDEIVNGVLQNNNGQEEEKPYQQIKDKKSFRKKPFTSPNFE